MADDLARFIVSEVRRQVRKGAGVDFRKVSSVDDDGAANIEYRPGKTIKVYTSDNTPFNGQSLNLSKSGNAIWGNGNALYG